MDTLKGIDKELTQAWAQFEAQQSNEQTRGNSTGAFKVSYLTKLRVLLEAGIPIPYGATPRQITDTPIEWIRQGFLWCCDYSNPRGYQTLIRISQIGMSEKQIEMDDWARRAMQQYGIYGEDHDKVNRIRHMATPYDNWRRQGVDSFTAFMRANLQIAEWIPELRKAAIEQIGHKRTKLKRNLFSKGLK